VRLRALSIVAALALSGCFRSEYRTMYWNLHPPNSPPVVETPESLAKRPRPGWNHFFVWGWFPARVEIDAAAQCGGEEHVFTIETRQTYLQRLVASLAGRNLVNVYSPWHGHVTCDHVAPAQKG
jgi:hypothetical protein